MLRHVIDFFRSGPDRTPIQDPATVRRFFERRRWSVFLSVTLGYAMFYVCRVNFSAAKPRMLDEGVMDAAEMGVAGALLLVAYAVGKFFNGILADRANIARFFSTGLLLSAVVNLILGFQVPFLLFAALWAVNGWLQAAGSAPCIVSLSQWFSQRERGTRYGIWCISHNLGEGITFIVTASLVGAFGWRWGFFGPGLLCLGAALVLYRTMADRPQCYGLPSVAEYKNDPVAPVAATENVGRLQLEVLRNPAVWILGLSSALMYIARYAMNNWGFVWLEKGKGYSGEEAGYVLAVYAVMGFIGSFTSGLISDAFFQSRRNGLALGAGIAEIGALWALYLIPPGNPWLDGLAMAVFGYSMGILVAFLGGLMAVDIVPPRVAGAAAGVVGMISYVGAAVQDAVSGWLIDGARVVAEDGTVTYSFDGAFTFWVAASVTSATLALLVWNKGPALPAPVAKRKESTDVLQGRA